MHDAARALNAAVEAWRDRNGPSFHRKQERRQIRRDREAARAQAERETFGPRGRPVSAPRDTDQEHEGEAP